MNRRQDDLDRILGALKAAEEIYCSHSAQDVRVQWKSAGDPVTDTERRVNDVLFEKLVRDGEGWVSEESAVSESRFGRARVWFVDPLDGTKEYISGIPEWCISVALLQDGELVAAGICNPVTHELFYGSRETGIVCEPEPSQGAANLGVHSNLPVTLASRSEVKRGEWERFREVPIGVKPMGSVAYKLALVAAGKADATWTLVPKHEWDVAAGVALMLFSGGSVLTSQGELPELNKRDLLFPGLIAFSQAGIKRLQPFLDCVGDDPAFQDCLPWVTALKCMEPRS